MSVWLCIPSKRPAEEAGPLLAKWKERGYRVALYFDEKPAHRSGLWDAELHTPPGGKYPGYAEATNQLIAFIQRLAGSADWFVIGGDDVEPDPNHTADEIARECSVHFINRMVEVASMGADRQRLPQHLRISGDKLKSIGPIGSTPGATFGVMQPTGDRWGDSDLSRAHHGNDRGAYIDRICGSAWLGREFCKRVNQGRGPLWPEYFHMFVDEELQAVAEKLGILWQRPDLTQIHHHWGRKPGASRESIPDFLKAVNKKEHWDKYKALFLERQAAGFPGSELIA